MSLLEQIILCSIGTKRRYGRGGEWEKGGREGWREGRVEGEGWEVVEERKGGQEKVWEGEGEREGVLRRRERVLEEGREELWRVGSRWERRVWSEGRGRVCLFGAKCCFPLSLSMYRTTEVGNFVWKLLSIIAEEENLELR